MLTVRIAPANSCEDERLPRYKWRSTKSVERKHQKTDCFGLNKADQLDRKEKLYTKKSDTHHTFHTYVQMGKLSPIDEMIHVISGEQPDKVALLLRRSYGLRITVERANLLMLPMISLVDTGAEATLVNNVKLWPQWRKWVQRLLTVRLLAA